MIKLLKEMWHKWRASVCFAQVEICGMKRLDLKQKQVALKAKGDLHLASVRELKRK